MVTTGLFAPSAIKLAGHTLEKRCVDHDTNHIHDTTTHCDFHDVTLIPQVFWISYYCILVHVVFYVFLVSFYTFFFQPYQKDFLPLRGPPLQTDYETGDGLSVTNSRFKEKDLKTGIGYQSTKFKTELRYNYIDSDLGIPEEIGVQNNDRNPIVPRQEVSSHIVSSKTQWFFKKASLEATLGYIFRCKVCTKRIQILGRKSSNKNSTHLNKSLTYLDKISARLKNYPYPQIVL